jgi:brefeldin A-resistance guanine nucleotide exchange factor 1
MIDASAVLHPFLLVIRSSSTPAHITSLALIAITKFFAYRIISPASEGVAVAMQLLATAVTHCRFEAVGSTANEIVLFRVLTLMDSMITGPCGVLLSDGSMFDLLKTGMEMCSETTFSELLRRTAEVHMTKMCQTLFQRLKSFEVELLDPTTRQPRSSTKIEPQSIISDEPVVVNKPTELSEAQEGQIVPLEGEAVLVINPAESRDSITVASNGALDAARDTEAEEQIDVKPYGVPAVRELFRALVGLLNPDDKQRTDGARIMALRIVDVTLEVAGPSISSHPSLATLAKDTLCRHLFQLVRSDNIAVLTGSLRVAGTLLATCRTVLKLQQELFLSYLVACLHPRVEIPQEAGIDPAIYEGVPQAPRLAKPAPSQAGSGRSTPVPVKDRQKLGMEGSLRKPDALEAMLENVGTLVRVPSFMAELFVNYDCDIDRGDLCQDMVGLLSRSAIPDSALWSTETVPPLCLDALLGFVQSIHERLDDTPNSGDFPSLEHLRKQRELKKMTILGATKFNEKPKAGLAYLASQQIIDDLDNPHSIAKFLRGTSRVDKKVLGEYLSKKGNEALLQAFLDTFNFRNLRIDEALRQLLVSFRLPGESALIERIVVDFTKKYLDDSHTGDIEEADAAYVLTYAIIMLNTDQHNPNVKGQKRMASTDFARNLRGTNGNKDFDPEFLQEIFDSIRTNEIVLPEERDDQRSFDHAWKSLLFKVESSGELKICDTNLFDADMFAATWKPIVATLSYVFTSATDETVFARVNAGFIQAAQIASKYGLSDALDRILFSLSSMSTLATPTLPSTSLNTEVQVGEKSIMVSETAVRFGRNERAQLATTTLFQVIEGNEAAVRDGWTYVSLLASPPTEILELTCLIRSCEYCSTSSLTHYLTHHTLAYHHPRDYHRYRCKALHRSSKGPIARQKVVCFLRSHPMSPALLAMSHQSRRTKRSRIHCILSTA